MKDVSVWWCFDLQVFNGADDLYGTPDEQCTNKIYSMQQPASGSSSTIEVADGSQSLLAKWFRKLPHAIMYLARTFIV